ncbi:NADP-reducing hydrogenase subunit HndC [Sedimentisphaera cyanobacteriorum]|uniref:NADP-reducing hydrogenase subunit HndC n=1 Tax=Sedimentisphaera cyanobacteriorum TaxID=1940790 RepID=A0A1Q2HLB4_9BACT|nr:NADH-quinone oxidoreductase subunit NuoF [Sedimentisphaera cyanobacteriorum]AQQ08257.1 NADP-reducing hydrogenase subunit HndC [Sedimentisphaera cyanobacteriorum]
MDEIKKFNSLEEFKKISEQLRESSTQPGDTEKIFICTGGGCIASGALNLRDELKSCLQANGLSEKVQVVETGCMGPCSAGPVLLMGRDKTFYVQVQPDDAEEIVQSHIMQNKLVERLCWRDEKTDKPAASKLDIEFFKKQTKIALRNCGLITPTDLRASISVGGFDGLAAVLAGISRDEVIEQLKDSGLRGRGGAGFPTHMKWTFTKKSPGEVKYVVCNADEGDPGAFMDRSVLEGDPYSLIEGMSIAAYTIGAQRGFVYVRAEYPLAIERLSESIEKCYKAGLLGENILGTDFSFDLEIRKGSGAFVCGEETALMASIEGKRGEPRPRPPFPAQKGLWDKPTVLNNVETYANVAAIVAKGGKWFASFGTEKSRGTKVFALAGAIRNSGLVEVPIGTTLGDLIYDIGGGIPNGKAFKAAQIGGPSGGCVPLQHLNVSLDYESLNKLGAVMGSGGLVVMDEDTCMVDVARFFLEFVQEESCGKCIPCRVGTKRMLEILDKICSGQGEQGDIERLEALGEKIRDTALCGLGQTAPNPVLSTVRHFRDEYEAHIIDKHCPAGVCPDMVLAPCKSACPAGVNIPGFVSLVGEERYAEALRLHRERNPFAAVCARVCFHTCEEKCRRSSLDEPVSIRGVKRFMVDQEIVAQIPEVHENDENAKRKIAVIGAGPSGFSCAYFLARLGYKPTVFEARSRPGGMLVQAIPEYRLPKEIIAREYRMIQGMGVKLVTDSKLGKDFTLQQLREQGYEAVYLAIGQPDGVMLNMAGSDAEGVKEALDFLREYNMKGSVEAGKNVAIIGGGNSAIDAARTAVRLGANVTVVYRRTQSEMPAYAEEIEESQQEGVRIIELASPERIVTENGRVSGLKCKKMKLGDYDASGRKKPVASGEEFTLDADQVIFAVGQTMNLEPIFGKVINPQGETGYEYFVEVGNEKLRLNGKSKISAGHQNAQTSINWLFCGGDAAMGAASVVEAIGEGEKAAVGIDEYLTGANHAFWREDVPVDTYFDPDEEPKNYPRKKMELLSIERRINSFAEVEQPWDKSEAIRQAQRCLRCDYGKYKCPAAKMQAGVE